MGHSMMLLNSKKQFISYVVYFKTFLPLMSKKQRCLITFTANHVNVFSKCEYSPTSA